MRPTLEDVTIFPFRNKFGYERINDIRALGRRERDARWHEEVKKLQYTRHAIRTQRTADGPQRNRVSLHNTFSSAASPRGYYRTTLHPVLQLLLFTVMIIRRVNDF